MQRSRAGQISLLEKQKEWEATDFLGLLAMLMHLEMNLWTVGGLEDFDEKIRSYAVEKQRSSSPVGNGEGVGWR